ncbi:glutathione S-transferase family protein|uniref:glutathione S-transferase family protein n=1 Tax=Noviherbaspirillum sp. L7-7A TaxID=2850560 RepID=UPI001C2BAA2D|nr:glutathione S-transferase family protein [Noviherbaspirillum sp. L7-7A]MBV0878992.1 glutathione S-transferase family protein [Noviherbaspirillum sp. L7-7A]
MQAATLTITSKNYSSWSMRGWLLARLAGLSFEEIMIPSDDPAMRAEILLLAPSVLVPCLRHEGITVWDTLAIGEYLNEIRPGAQLLPKERKARAHCRAICGEMHSGFSALRSALPMNLKANYGGFRIWARAQADIDRIAVIWRECINTYGGPYLFGSKVCMADAMFAPVVTRFLTYGVELDAVCRGYCDTVMALEPVQEWVSAALAEPEEIDELEAEF